MSNVEFVSYPGFDFSDIGAGVFIRFDSNQYPIQFRRPRPTRRRRQLGRTWQQGRRHRTSRGGDAFRTPAAPYMRRLLDLSSGAARGTRAVAALRAGRQSSNPGCLFIIFTACIITIHVIPFHYLNFTPHANETL